MITETSSTNEVFNSDFTEFKPFLQVSFSQLVASLVSCLLRFGSASGGYYLVFLAFGASTLCVSLAYPLPPIFGFVLILPLTPNSFLCLPLLEEVGSVFGRLTFHFIWSPIFSIPLFLVMIGFHPYLN